ncbi:sodium:solute symporter [Parabacteroides sp. 52]|uniref:sodium:solute symporter family protein n=1 Tax=unclassified Parabacteroides TaxID=2649774 RepID=UPI0013D0DE9A|nr:MULTISPECIES: sodium:solute symporter family protein [unclassified Parabacteroides]MDH6534495.1 SSS family solute:Na+ symporter [Parabacteroides sp. PM5-20]NDV55055.1 sodium:solute symporter [Parabacteroides sp. 52]
MNLELIDVLIIALYLVVMIIIGLVLKKRASKNLDSYFLGGKTLPFYMLGLSNASGMFDISGTMWMVYLAFVYGLKSLWVPWLWPVFNQIFLMVYLSIWLRRSNVLTGAEWIRTRFGYGRGANLSHTVVILYAVIGVLGFLSYGFIGIGKFMEIFFPWEVVSQFVPFDVAPEYVPHLYGIFFTTIATFYVMLGGMLSIVWTDVVQFGIMTVAGVVIAAIAMMKVSPDMLAAHVPAGWDSPFFGWTLDLDWSNLIPSVMDKMALDQYNLFTVFVMMMLFKGVFLSMAGPAPNYDMQKILACKSPKEAALMSGSVPVILLIPRYLMIMGFAVLAIVFFSDDFNAMGSAVDFETILPRAISEFVPVGLAGLLLAGLLAAFMSTFASTVNAAPAYLVNDVYLKYINPKASNKTQIRASYIISVSVVVISTVIGFFVLNINSVLQWIVSALYGGYIAANLLKWHWWRFNGYGYFWGMLVGIVAAMIVPQFFPHTLPLYYFPVLMGVSLIGCIVGTLLTEPTDEETLIDFYIRVRPWGFWGPVATKACERYPQVKRNTHFKRDMFNIAVGILWQSCLTIIPMYIVIKEGFPLFTSILILGITTLILKKNWYDKMNKEEKEYDMLMSEINLKEKNIQS